MIRDRHTFLLVTTARGALVVLAFSLLGATSAAAQQTTRKPETRQTQKPATANPATSKPSTAKPSTAKPSTAKPSATKPAAGAKPGAKPAAAAPAADTAKPALVETFNDWGAYATRGAKAKTCYALSQPKERAPAVLKRDPAFVFISQRPAENVRNEVSIIMGFDVKPDGPATVAIGDTTFEMVSKGANLWVKNAAQEGELVEALRKGARMIVKAPSLRGNVSTDSYSLSGISAALDRVQRECR